MLVEGSHRPLKRGRGILVAPGEEIAVAERHGAQPLEIQQLALRLRIAQVAGCP